MKNSLMAAAAALLVMGGAAHAAQFVVNGDFTDVSNGVGEFDTNTTVTGWSGNGGYNFDINAADVGAPGTDGNVALWDMANGGSSTWDGLTANGKGNFAALDGDFQTKPITETITGLTVGKSYRFSFKYAFAQQSGFTGDTTQSLTASLGSFSDTLPSAGGTTLPSKSFSGWSTFSTKVVADSTTETLSFLAGGGPAVPPFALVSDVSLTGSAGVGSSVPESSTWAMMLIGFGGLGFAAYRSRGRTGALA